MKQRREISAGTAVFVDQGPVRAALNGRVLIIDGLEKAERNVLPTLNNLLENREMSLDDGRCGFAHDLYTLTPSTLTPSHTLTPSSLTPTLHPQPKPSPYTLNLNP